MVTSLPAPAVALSPTARWASRILSGLVVAFLTFDAIMKLSGHAEVAKASARLGLPGSLAPTLGILLLVCVALYLIPRTAPLGAVLLTGYLGGAVLTHLRVGDPLLSHTLFPVFVGVAAWAGLYLRDARVRALLL